MALNWVQLNNRNKPLPIQDEVFVREEPNAELLITLPPSSAPSQTSLNKGKGRSNSLKSTGTVFVSDQRLVFVSDAPKENIPTTLNSFSCPHLSILSINFNQPFFGSNYLSFDIKPTPEGGLTEGTKGELRLRDKGIFELVATLEKSRERCLYKKRDEVMNPPALPVYTSFNDNQDLRLDATTSQAAGPRPPSGVPEDLPPAYDG